MKRHFLLFLCSLALFFTAGAAPGDTTWVQAHAGTQLTWYGDYDNPVSFPSGSASYRKIFMIFKLGKYSCPGYDPNNPGDGPGQTGWCGDWDYTVQNYLMTSAGDTIELARLITPYARENSPRTPLTWTERYIFDVTDFYPLLKNDADLRIHYSGYSGGFTADISFAFIEGTPERNVIGIDKTYSGSYAYGNAGDPIENHYPTLNKTAPANTVSAEFKFTVTGHGADNNYCSEFCKKFYKVIANGNTEQKDIWRDNCGMNNLYPQPGTWIYDRGNWCPGALVHTNSHLLNGVAAGTNYDLNVDFEDYTGSGSASYTVESAIFYYGGLNHSLNAALEDVIAPNDHESNYRGNPLCGTPRVLIRNTGSTPVTSIKFEYGVEGFFLPQYVWSGSIAPLTEQEIDLPEPWELRAASGDNATKTFIARMLEVNGQADEDATDNEVKTTFKAAPKWTPTLAIRLRTNSATVGGVSETSWKIYDLAGNVVKERTGNAPNTTYNDTVTLGPSCYTMVVEDLGCDGLSFWANPGAGSGTLLVKTPGIIPAIPLTGYFSGDFGCGFTQYFTTNWPTGIESTENTMTGGEMEVFPNPAKGNATVNISGVKTVKGTLNIVDAAGRTVMQQFCNSPSVDLNLTGLSSGIYNVVFRDDAGAGLKLQSRLVITR
jgi:hypothetical protein